MRITSLIDNYSQKGFRTEHGLSLYIQTRSGKNILFDMGQGHLLAENATQFGLSLRDIDFAVISHGHYDHGGGLSCFLKENDMAPIYIRREAFLPCYSLRDKHLHYLGLDIALATERRLILCKDKTHISNDIIIFGNVKGKYPHPPANRFLKGIDKVSDDLFLHEQHLIIQEGENVVLFCGCAHCGILNIIDTATDILGRKPSHIIGGMHLAHSLIPHTEEKQLVDRLSLLLMEKGCKYITMHCTGLPIYNQLSSIMQDRISYLSCGDVVTL